PNLRPERGLNADVGIAGRRQGPGGRTLSASATVFGGHIDDLIDWTTGSYVTRAENVASVRVLGVEGELRFHAGPLLGVAQATLTDARDLGPRAANIGRQIAHHPRYRGYARLEWQRPLGVGGAVVARAFAEIEGLAGLSSSGDAYGQRADRA